MALGPTVTPGKPITGRRVVLADKPLEVVRSDEGTVWYGEGPPPPDGASGIAVGDTYIDNLTGQIYRLDPGE